VRFSLAVTSFVTRQQTYSTSSGISTKMDYRARTYRLGTLTSYRCQLSLAIPPWYIHTTDGWPGCVGIGSYLKYQVPRPLEKKLGVLQRSRMRQDCTLSYGLSLSHRRPCINDAVYHNQQILSETCARRIVLLKLLTDTKHARPFCDSRATCFIPNMHSMPEPHRNLVIIFRRETLEWWATRR